MKKKPLLFALLALAIITSLTAGTLAVYTKSLSIDSTVAVKRFAFNTKGNDNFIDAIRLAPTESLTKGFTVTNYTDEKEPAEVPLSYTIAVNIDAASAMKGLTAELWEKGPTRKLLQRGAANESFIYTATKELTASTPVVHDYEVVLTWVDNGNGSTTQATYAEKAESYKSGLVVTVQATQVTTPTTGNGGNGA